MGARGVSSENAEKMENMENMENMEMFSGSPLRCSNLGVLRFSENRALTEMCSGSPY